MNHFQLFDSCQGTPTINIALHSKIGGEVDKSACLHIDLFEWKLSTGGVVGKNGLAGKLLGFWALPG